MIKVAVEALNLDAYIPKQLTSHLGIGRRSIYRLTAAIANQCVSVDRQLVAPRLTPKIVVVIKYPYALIGATLIAKKLGGGEPGDTATHNDKIVIRVRLIGGHRKRPTLARQSVGYLVGACDAAPHTGERWWVIVGAECTHRESASSHCFKRRQMQTCSAEC